MIMKKETKNEDTTTHPRAGKMPALPAPPARPREGGTSALRARRPASVTRLGGLIRLKVR